MSQTIIPARLKAARERMGITMAEASRRLHMSKIGYCRYEYGQRAPSLQTTQVIAQCFHTSVDYLLGNTDDFAPDRIVIRKDSAPELFEIVRQLDSLDPAARQRLFAYFQKLTGQQDQ